MSREGADFSEALGRAQALGYAEPDPTNDVEGEDARYKLSILASGGSSTGKDLVKESTSAGPP
jgi:homoserine dehydrogenase